MEDAIKTAEMRARDILELFKREMGGFRTNRPAAQLIEDIKVEYAGSLMPLKHVGSITVVPPRDLVVTVWDGAALLPAAKAIEDSKKGLTASVQGNAIRMSLPPMSDERREELVRLVKTVAEKFRIQLRGLRDEINKKIEAAAKAKEVNEDQKFKLRERVQKCIDSANKDIEEQIARKSAEINE